jgi:hypothetical protein
MLSPRIAQQWERAIVLRLGRPGQWNDQGKGRQNCQSDGDKRKLRDALHGILPGL